MFFLQALSGASLPEPWVCLILEASNDFYPLSLTFATSTSPRPVNSSVLGAGASLFYFMLCLLYEIFIFTITWPARHPSVKINNVGSEQVKMSCARQRDVTEWCLFWSLSDSFQIGKENSQLDFKNEERAVAVTLRHTFGLRHFGCCVLFFPLSFVFGSVEKGFTEEMGEWRFVCFEVVEFRLCVRLWSVNGRM